MGLFCLACKFIFGRAGLQDLDRRKEKKKKHTDRIECGPGSNQMLLI